MPVDTAFAPYRLKPGALPEEASQLASQTAAEPLLVGLGDPLPGAMVNRALAEIAAGRAAAPDEACRAADGSPSGVAGALRSCLSSERQRGRIADAAQTALGSGFAGICLDHPDAPLALGLLGAGFCTECQRAFARELSREYGEQFQPIDYLALAREALTDSPGAVGYAQLPFGREFWRLRHDALERAISSYARAARDGARVAGRPFDVTAQFAALGPAQFRSARHLDAAIFPSPLAASSTGVGMFRLLRAVMGRRPCAVVLPPGALSGQTRLPAIAAACGVEISGLDDPGDGPATLAAVRRLARLAGGRPTSPTSGTPVAECAILYSGECDLWSGGRHRDEVLRAGDALAALHVQAPVVLAQAEALSPREASEVRRRVEAGSGALVLGDLGTVDEAGRPASAPLPEGKPSGLRVGKGMVAALPALAPAHGTAFVPDPRRLEPLSRSLSALLGKGRRAGSVVSRAPLLVLLYQSDGRLDVHLVTLDGRSQGTTLFLGLHVAGGVKRARFQSADGTDEKIVMNPSGYSISTVLPSFEGYAVLSLPA